MKPIRVAANAERWALDTVTAILAAAGRTEPAGTDLSGSWTRDAPMFVQVADDGTPGGGWPVRTVTTVRVTVWGGAKTPARDLAALLMGRLLATSGVSEGTGLLPAKDDATKAALVSFTVSVSLRTLPA